MPRRHKVTKIYKEFHFKGLYFILFGVLVPLWLKYLLTQSTNNGKTCRYRINWSGSYG